MGKLGIAWTKIKLRLGVASDIYHDKRETQVVRQGEIGGRRYRICSVKGIAPVVYLEAKKDWRGEKTGKGGCPAHGGFTWFGRMTDDDFNPTTEEYYLSWDFMSEGDYLNCGEYGDELAYGKLWTVGKIMKNVKAVAGWLDEKEKQDD